VLGIGIITYNRLHELRRCLRSMYRVATEPFKLVVWDNTEKNATIREFVTKSYPDIVYLSDHTNRGCAVGRNRIYSRLRELYGDDLEYFLYLDQDVEILPGSISSMIELSKQREDWGAISWPQANMSNCEPLNDGLVSDIAGMCSLYRPEALEAVAKRSKVGIWDERFLFYRFDSLLAQRLNHEGYYIYLVMKYYVTLLDYSQQVGGVIHHHPHLGVQMNPHYHRVKEASNNLYNRIMKEEGWKFWNPRREGKPSPYHKRLMGL